MLDTVVDAVLVTVVETVDVAVEDTVVVAVDETVEVAVDVAVDDAVVRWQSVYAPDSRSLMALFRWPTTAAQLPSVTTRSPLAVHWMARMTSVSGPAISLAMRDSVVTVAAQAESGTVVSTERDPAVSHVRAPGDPVQS